MQATTYVKQDASICAAHCWLVHADLTHMSDKDIRSDIKRERDVCSLRTHAPSTLRCTSRQGFRGPSGGLYFAVRAHVVRATDSHDSMLSDGTHSVGWYCRATSPTRECRLRSAYARHDSQQPVRRSPDRQQPSRRHMSSAASRLHTAGCALLGLSSRHTL